MVDLEDQEQTLTVTFIKSERQIDLKLKETHTDIRQNVTLESELKLGVGAVRWHHFSAAPLHCLGVFCVESNLVIFLIL